MDTPVQLSALRAGEIDLGVVRNASPAAGIQTEDLFSEPMVLALPETHFLTSAKTVSAAHLRDEPFILWPRASSPTIRDQVFAYCQTAGFMPRVVMEGADIQTQLGLVSAAIGVSPQPASFANLRRHGVVFKPLRRAPRSTVQVAWLEAAPPRHLAEAVHVARELARAV
jgi:DNA-binding transcriptional LysR family regulator